MPMDSPETAAADLSPSAAPPDSKVPGGPALPRRWYFHRWNTSLSWNLILRITPKLPGFLLRPLHHATSLLFFACLPRERGAVRRNLRRVTGKRGLPNVRLAYRLFWNFSRYLVAYAQMKNLELGQFRHRLSGMEEVEEGARRLLQEEKGLIIATMHLGHWDLGLKLLTAFRRPIHVVMLQEEPEEVARITDEVRRIPGMNVHLVGDNPLLALELLLALKRGELVAVQIDRPVGRNIQAISLFGAPAPLPTGPVQLAMASGAPVIPAFVLLERGTRFRLLVLPPLRFEPPQAGREEEALREAMRRMARMMESAVSLVPDQWFNFYDVWPAATAGGAASEGKREEGKRRPNGPGRGD